MHARQRGLASVALVVMLLIMVSVAAITLSRMASSGLSESADTSLTVAALAAADSALERSAYRLATTSDCAGLLEGPQTIGAPNTTQASYQVLSGTGIPGGCRVRIQSYIGNIANPRVLRLSEGDIAGGVVVPQDFPIPSPAWLVSAICAPLPCLSGVLGILGDVFGGLTGALTAQTLAGLPGNQALQVNADYTLSAPFTANSGVPVPLSFYWRKDSQALGSVQTVSVQLIDSVGGSHIVWMDATIANTGWVYVNGNLPVPASANGRTIVGVRLRFDLNEGATGSRVGAAFDRVQVGGLIAWRELPN
jgi:hypothetical protein